MPEREWKPEDVALVRTFNMKDRGREPVRALRTISGWVGAMGVSAPDSEVEDARPLVVIDPENAEAVERLVDLYWSVRKGDRTRISAMQAALREFADPKPPKPEEPTGLGAVVEDADGNEWTRFTRVKHGCAWVRQTPEATYLSYREISAVRVLSPGYTPWLLEDDDA